MPTPKFPSSSTPNLSQTPSPFLLDLNQIRKLALAAGGEGASWTPEIRPSLEGRIVDQNGEIVVYVGGSLNLIQAFHIASMDPSTTLKLLDMIEELEARLDMAGEHAMGEDI